MLSWASRLKFHFSFRSKIHLNLQKRNYTKSINLKSPFIKFGYTKKGRKKILKIHQSRSGFERRYKLIRAPSSAASQRNWINYSTFKNDIFLSSTFFPFVTDDGREEREKVVESMKCDEDDENEAIKEWGQQHLAFIKLMGRIELWLLREGVNCCWISAVTTCLHPNFLVIGIGPKLHNEVMLLTKLMKLLPKGKKLFVVIYYDTTVGKRGLMWSSWFPQVNHVIIWTLLFPLFLEMEIFFFSRFQRKWERK